MTALILIAWAVCIFWARQVAIRNGASADLGLILGVLLGPIGVAVAYTLSPDHPLVQKFDRPIPLEDETSYKRLVRMARGDKELAERLIEYERKRNPNASRLTHIQQAIDHWMLDNR